MYNETVTALTAFNNLRTLLSSLMTLRDGEMVRAQVYEINDQLMTLQSKMMEAQSTNHDQQSRIRELEGELAALKDRINDRERYQMHQFETGVFAQRLKPEYHGELVEHFLCNTCFDSGSRAVLQPYETVLSVGYNCPHCKNKIVIKNKPQPEQKSDSYQW
jgi:capsule polysaccharide export protein KpsE/RkpR